MDLTRKTDFFEGWSLSKFSNLGLVLGMALDFFLTEWQKQLKLQVRKLGGTIPTFGRLTGKNMAGGGKEQKNILKSIKIFSPNELSFTSPVFDFFHKSSSNTIIILLPHDKKSNKKIKNLLSTLKIVASKSGQIIE